MRDAWPYINTRRNTRRRKQRQDFSFYVPFFAVISVNTVAGAYKGGKPFNLLICYMLRITYSHLDNNSNSGQCKGESRGNNSENIYGNNMAHNKQGENVTNLTLRYEMPSIKDISYFPHQLLHNPFCKSFFMRIEWKDFLEVALTHTFICWKTT